MKKFVIYEIRNVVNNMIYIGAHVTENINDSYMGSGTLIREAIRKEGVENFEKKILYIFNNAEEMILKEHEIVNWDFVGRTDTYNLIPGGGKYSHNAVVVFDKCGQYMFVDKNDPRYLSGELKFISTGKVNVKDKNGKGSRVNVNDPRFLSGELVSTTKGKVSVKDKDGNFLFVDVNDFRYLSGELVSNMTGLVKVVNKNGEYFNVEKNDPRYLSGEFIPFCKGKISVKDKNGNIFLVDKEDPRYLSGELKHFWTGKKHRKETKDKIGKANSKKQIGEKNSQHGTRWITNGVENKKIKKDLPLPKNWKYGRK